MLGFKASRHEDCDCLDCQKKALKKEIRKLTVALSEVPFENARKRVTLIAEISCVRARLDRLNKKKHTKHGTGTILARSQENLPTLPPLVDLGSD